MQLRDATKYYLLPTHLLTYSLSTTEHITSRLVERERRLCEDAALLPLVSLLPQRAHRVRLLALGLARRACAFDSLRDARRRAVLLAVARPRVRRRRGVR